MKKRLITSALPYVNNVPHLGNLLQVLSADVFARFCRSKGYETLYVCGTDEYGTATETRALQEHMSPRELCDHYHAIHKEIYKWFNISFDYFGRTSTPKQTEIVQHIFRQVYDAGYITVHEEEQLYCPHCGRFLADRFVTGTCPHCGYEKARGDQCEHCGTLLDPTELKEPKCSVCGTTPVLKKTKHLYLDLPKALPMLEKWMDKASVEGFWANNAIQITKSWIRDGLKDRAITRDLKWGIPVPLEGFEDKVFYVWFDACIGYVSISAYATENWKDWWFDPEHTELFQFIGKDNIPFHTVIFPATQLATGDNWTMLHHMSSTEYLNYEGGKFSKSQGIGIFGNDVESTGIPADVWRFYLYYNRPETSDFTFTWADFQEKVNKELIGNLSNLVNRTVTFTKKVSEGYLESGPVDEEFRKLVLQYESKIDALMERADEREALRAILALSSAGNKMFQDAEPWKTKNTDMEATKKVLRTLCFLIEDLAVLIEPFMPATSAKLLGFFGIEKRTWKELGSWDGDIRIGDVELLFQRLEDDRIAALRERFSGSQKEREEKAREAAPKQEQKKQKEGANKHNMGALDPNLTIAENFQKHVILKVAEITNVVKHPEGDKLYILTLNDGSPNPRTIVSSIVPFYKAEELQGRHIVLVSNLKPANFRGVKSYGMLLAASDPTAPNPHDTCEVLFPDDIPAGTVLEPEGFSAPTEDYCYVKPEPFFAMPMTTKDGVLMVDGKKIVSADGKEVHAHTYVNGNVG
ncbi:MAG: methionine--tRNA ligase [Sphaerochaetaceae bacterium]|nr:methionine--tRNA ligase [Spirochaetales bacterium]MDY5499863.1 methionine--tRNA ligase [Sphaerochaetaceae bacterium]